MPLTLVFFHSLYWGCHSYLVCLFFVLVFFLRSSFSMRQLCWFPYFLSLYLFIFLVYISNCLLFHLKKAIWQVPFLIFLRKVSWIYLSMRHFLCLAFLLLLLLLWLSGLKCLRHYVVTAAIDYWIVSFAYLIFIVLFSVTYKLCWNLLFCVFNKLFSSYIIFDEFFIFILIEILLHFLYI